MKTRHYIVAAAFILFFVLIRFVGEIGIETVDKYKVIKVIDGDTFELENRGKLRLLAIDTPEHGQPFHDSALAVLSKMVLNKEVDLQFEVRKRDKYKRLLAYVFVDSLFVNAEMLSAGLAGLYLFPNNSSDRSAIAELLQSQREAMAKEVGIWSLHHVPSDYYLANSKRMRFHRPDCHGAKSLKPSNRVVFETRESACYDGYSPCRTCQP